MRRILIYIAAAVAVSFVSCGSSGKDDADSVRSGEEVMKEMNVEKPRGGWKIKAGPRYSDRIHINRMDSSLSLVFNDSNYRQYYHAERLGIDPIDDIGGAYFTKRPLIRIESNDVYAVDKLTHSAPYLVPEAAALLHHLGVAFIDSLGSRGADGYRIKVTSMLRTRQSVKSLRRVNRNATDSSTHKFGTTFDISWSNFVCSDSTRTINSEDLKNLLAEVLFDARAEGRCLVKFERKTACFHITAIR